MLRNLARSIFDLCLPRQCSACGVWHELPAHFRADCESQLRELATSPRCTLCAMPLTIPDAPCVHCQSGGFAPFKKIVCIGVLKDALKSTIHHAKYHRRWRLAEILADRLSMHEDLRALLASADVLVPVALHASRQRTRGYNQSDVIARRFVRKDLPVRSAAVRVIRTETQTHMHSPARRTENLKDAFVLTDPAAVTGRRVVVVDDVMTTGATLLSLARTLRPAKPASLSAIVLAVADPKGRHFEVI